MVKTLQRKSKKTGKTTTYLKLSSDMWKNLLDDLHQIPNNKRFFRFIYPDEIDVVNRQIVKRKNLYND